ncbi:MAG: GNAT family N-acetyltransferase [Phycisphaerales bacterium]|nr:MAG: GNAT family N-acetyltransferase [Phycisphaerales bacterium]
MTTDPEAENAKILPDLPVRFELKDGRECVVRSVVEDDAADFCRLLPQSHRESDFLNYLPGEFDWTVEKEREFIRDQLAMPRTILLCAVVDGAIAGFGGGMSNTQHKRLSHHAEFGLAVLKEFWAQGIGRKLCEIIIDWGRRLELRKMCLKVFADNTGAIALYEKLGFIEEGRLKDDWLRGDGSFGDSIIMARFYEG